MIPLWTIQGRLNRRPYIFWSIGLTLPTLIIGRLPQAYGFDFPLFVLLPLAVLVLAAAVLGFLLAIRRFHDLDKSGWWSLLFLIPFVNFVAGLYLMFVRGTDGPNRFGPDPLAAGV